MSREIEEGRRRWEKKEIEGRQRGEYERGDWRARPGQKLRRGEEGNRRSEEVRGKE